MIQNNFISRRTLLQDMAIIITLMKPFARFATPTRARVGGRPSKPDTKKIKRVQQLSKK